MSQKKLHSTIKKSLSEIPDLSTLSVLDLSCGDAELLSELAELGCKTTGTRFIENDYIIKGAKIHPDINILNNVDLTKELPFETNSFDIIILKEVLEHLPSHINIIKEVSRILKPEGYLICSTPNIHRLHSRLCFLFTGSHKLIRRRIGWNLSFEDIYAYHHNPVDFPILHSLLGISGIKIKKMPCSTVKPKHFWLGLLYPLILIFSFLEYRKGSTRASESEEGEKDLRKWMTSKNILFSEQLVIVGKKIS